MRRFVYRRWRNFSILLFLVAAVTGSDTLLSVSSQPTSYLWGWLLLALLLGLTLYNLRKKIPFLPLGSSSLWLQFHIYGGLLSFVLFAVHIGYRIPSGIFETVLSILYLSVFFSGIAGLLLSRILPARLTTRGEEVLFERIPQFVRQVRESVEQDVVQCISEKESTAIPEFYLTRLKTFFERPLHHWQHLFHSSRPRQALLLDIKSQEPYLNEQEKELMQSIAERVCVKDDLDYQYALQATLKYWLFIHIPLTYVLLVFAIFHVVLVYAFAGGN